ncbi:MAG: hypothetical protein KDD69_16765 [Bdellovibrionales bacterium]|nr:hypothetical protein [Bdellovibrionales bacterium]
MRSLFIATAVLNILLPTLCAYALSPEEAYEAISHRRTEFQAEQSTLDRDEALNLEQLFQLVDRAVVQRVQTLQWFTSGGVAGKTVSSYNAQTEQIISEFDFLVRPRELAPVRQLILSAIEDQKQFFYDSHRRLQTGGTFAFRGTRDPLVASSSRKLREALARLQKRYPNESAHNRRAFQDHLGALDFVQAK